MVGDLARRLEEAARLGFRRAIVRAADDLPRGLPVELLAARDVQDALGYLERPSRNGPRGRVAAATVDVRD